MNATWSPIGAQIEPRRTNSQPSANATGRRVANPTTIRPPTWPRLSPLTVRTWARAKSSDARTIAPLSPTVRRQARDREAPEDGLLGDRGDHGARDQLDEQADRRAGRRQRRLGLDAGRSSRGRTATIERERRSPARRAARPVARSRERLPSGRRQPISRHDRASVPTTVSRTTPTNTSAWSADAEQPDDVVGRLSRAEQRRGGPARRATRPRRSPRSSPRRRGTATAPRTASPRARRSIAWLPAPAIRPIGEERGPTK